MKQKTAMLLGAGLGLVAMALSAIFTHRLAASRTELLSRTVVEVVQGYVALSKDSSMADFSDRVLDAHGMVVNEMPLDGAAVMPSLIDGRGLEKGLGLALQGKLSLPIWINASGSSPYVEIRVACERAVLRIIARRPSA